MVSFLRSGFVKLEFDVFDGVISKRVFLLRRLGERFGFKFFLRKVVVRQQKVLQEVEEDDGRSGVGEDFFMLVFWGFYYFDWDKMDDLNFILFGGDIKFGCSEVQFLESFEIRLGQLVVEQLYVGFVMEELGFCLSQQLYLVLVEDMFVVQLVVEILIVESKERVLNFVSILFFISCLGSELVFIYQQGQFVLELKEESFRDFVEVLGMGVEVDYLEQFGIFLFKELVLRKQFLYFKFDFFLRDSFGRLVFVVIEISSMYGVNEIFLGCLWEVKFVEFDFLGVLDIFVLGLFLGVFVFGGLFLFIGFIVDLFQYSQKDLDVVVKVIQEENWELRSRCEEFYGKNLELGKIMDRFEEVVYQVMEEVQKQKEFFKVEIQKVLKEKD